ncbi:hypothetical protein HJD18_02005 [Thermoleophilia bacterium SCSIO 60948]|nr:hypothetical protein HJD18_02005 [Thermoleophilia bacterium SCSIO 60948]
MDGAIDQAIASHDVELAGTMLGAYAADLASHGRVATLDRHLEAFTREQVTETPTLALARITSAIVSGEGSEIDRLAAAIDRNLERIPAEHREALRSAADLVKAVSATSGELSRMASAASAARSMLPDDDPWQALAYFAEGTAAFLDGDNDEAQRLLEEGSRHGDVRAPTLRILCLDQLAVVALAKGNETEAWGYEEHAAASLERFGAGEYPTQVLGPAVSALIRARRGRTAEGFAAARRATALLARLPGVSAWYEAEVRVVLARAFLQLDDLGSARAQLDGAETYLRTIPDGPVLHAMFAEARDAASAAEAVGGRWPLTPAELRLLHLLPTHLSFREIADQLYVSTNTVKSQARSIYRKLGAASRAEAVAVARTGGLVTDHVPELREVSAPTPSPHRTAR